MTIRPRKYASGRVAYQVNIEKPDGTRVQKTFKTKGKAQAAIREAAGLLESHGERAAEISAAEMEALLSARVQVLEMGVTLSAVVDFYKSHAAYVREPLLLSELARRFREAKTAQKRKARYVRQLGVSLGSLVLFYPSKMAHEVTAENLERWIWGHEWAGKTISNYLGDVAAMFAWGGHKLRGHVQKNPALDIDREQFFRGGESEILTLDFEVCCVLLTAAASVLKLMGYLVLAMFCGIRPEEIKGVEWASVFIDEGHVVVGAAYAKTRRRRVVDLSENARAWLRLVPEEMRKGKVCGKGFHDGWRVFRRELGWDVARGKSNVIPVIAEMTRGDWPHNVLRHTFASYHYAFHQDEAKLQAQMGHESARMLHQHYRAVKLPAEAARFWAFFPPGQGRDDIAREVDSPTASSAPSAAS